MSEFTSISAKCATNLPNDAKYSKVLKFRLHDFVDLKKCCKMNIQLKKSVPIKPKTGHCLPKCLQLFSKICPIKRPPLRELQPRAATAARTAAGTPRRRRRRSAPAVC